MTEQKKKPNTNSNTEHSKKLRGMTANAAKQERVKSGVSRIITVELKTEVADEFDALAKTIKEGETYTRPRIFEFLLDFYKKNKG